jgi:hypothetical protein
LRSVDTLDTKKRKKLPSQRLNGHPGWLHGAVKLLHCFFTCTLEGIKRGGDKEWILYKFSLSPPPILLALSVHVYLLLMIRNRWKRTRLIQLELLFLKWEHKCTNQWDIWRFLKKLRINFPYKRWLFGDDSRICYRTRQLPVDKQLKPDTLHSLKAY